MYVMTILLLGSVMIGCSGRVSAIARTRLAVLAATLAAVVYLLFQKAM